MGRIEMGLKFSTRSTLPDLKTGFTFAVFQIVGTVLVINDKLMIRDNGSAISSAQSFNMFGGRESIPVALLRLSLFKCFSTYPGVMYENLKMLFVRKGRLRQ